MPDKTKTLRWLIGVGLSVPLVLLAITIFPFYYNENISPLGRFSKKVEIGMSEEKALEKINYFQSEHDGTTTINYRFSSIDLYGENIAESRIVSLHQESIFENIQFRVLFKDQLVAQKVLISD